MKTEKTLKIPFQRGYGEHYKTEALNALKKVNLIKIDGFTPLWKYCEENKIILRTNKQENCLCKYKKRRIHPNRP